MTGFGIDQLGLDTKITLLAAGVIFLWALILGVWKYHGIMTSPQHQAHVYVDIAHRAALMYAFATALIAIFVQLSAWSTTLNLIAAGVLVFFFVAAIASYCLHGALRDTDNQFATPTPGTTPFMYALIVGEIGAFAVLLAGFIKAWTS
ncbi:hypothetical protein GOEFS_008_00220 [Gordonia effusa NBRC 100432]|uniref:Integral membrane protein n=1 Tax=Gordonia effusa NBRC 100432 TaxID=1077974 RepID=H0QUW2_9ACTN|nr:hypothetical protein [Gordonia effusa]GAB16613.1 hypothetical protein GOEFS_008_00220 [Gordonia effusa NBRC 100432]